MCYTTKEKYVSVSIIQRLKHTSISANVGDNMTRPCIILQDLARPNGIQDRDRV